MIEWQIFTTFLQISLISIGGVFGVLPELERLIVTQNHWLTHDQFVQAFVVSQFVPGPNMALCPLIGYQIAGVSGWLAGFAGIYFAPLILVSVLVQIYLKARSLLWVKRVELSLRPVVLGLLGSSAYRLWSDQSADQRAFSFGLFAVLFWLYQKKKLSPLPVILIYGIVWLAFYFTLHF